MDYVKSMMALSGEIHVMMNSRKVDGADIAKKLAELADLGRRALAVPGDIDVTFDAARAVYAMTLTRPRPAAAPYNASSLMFAVKPGRKSTPAHLEVARTLNRLDAVLTREERIHDRR